MREISPLSHDIMSHDHRDTSKEEEKVNYIFITKTKISIL